MENNTVLQNTKYCLKCGKQCNENAVMCVGCGWDFKANTNKIETSQKQTGSQTSIFLILASGLYGFVELINDGIYLFFFESWKAKYPYWNGECALTHFISFPVDLLFIVFAIIGFKNRNNGKIFQIILSLFLISLLINDGINNVDSVLDLLIEIF